MHVQQLIRTPLSIIALALCLCAPAQALADVQWLNQLGFLAADANVTAAYDATAGGLSLSAAAAGDAAVVQGLQVAPGFLVEGVRVCYQATDAASYITQVAVAQLQDPASASLVPVLTEDADLASTDPVCVDTPLVTPVDPAAGPLSLTFAMTFGATPQPVVIRGVGLLVVADPESPLALALAQLQTSVDGVVGDVDQLQADMEALQEDVAGFENHTHAYLTGKGVGHNNTLAVTGEATFPGDPVVTPVAGKVKKNK